MELGKLFPKLRKGKTFLENNFVIIELEFATVY